MPRTPTVALVATLLLSACAEPASPNSPRPRPRREVVESVEGVADAAADAGSARFRVSLRVVATDGVSDPVVIDITTTGAFDGPRRELRSEMGAAFAAIGDGGGDGGGLPPGFEEPVELVVDAEMTYLRAPILDELLGVGTWVGGERAQASSGDRLDGLGVLAIGAGISGIDPLPVLDALSDASHVDALGVDEVDGVELRHIAARIDLAGVLTGMGSLRELPAELWIDDMGRPRRLVVDLGEPADVLGATETSPVGVDVAGSATMTVELYDYGAAIEILPPEQADVLPIEEARVIMRDALEHAGRGRP